MSEIRITDDYRDLNRQLHDQKLEFGAGGHRHADAVRSVAQVYGCKSLLDYGCGKQTLLEAIKLSWARGYDPCIPGLDMEPAPAELLVCTDTLEHVETECIEAVMDHMRLLSTRLLYTSISLVPAKKTLPDGRNTHLTVMPSEWWIWRLLARWKIDTVRCTDNELTGVFRVPGEQARGLELLNNIRK